MTRYSIDLYRSITNGANISSVNVRHIIEISLSPQLGDCIEIRAHEIIINVLPLSPTHPLMSRQCYSIILHRRAPPRTSPHRGWARGGANNAFRVRTSTGQMSACGDGGRGGNLWECSSGQAAAHLVNKYRLGRSHTIC